MDKFDKEKVKTQVMKIIVDLQALLIYIDSEQKEPLSDKDMNKILKKKAENKKSEESSGEEKESYKIAPGPCKTCGGLISWDGFLKGKGMHPKHVNEDGTLLGDDGECPDWKGGD